MNVIAVIPANNIGGKLFIKDLREDGVKLYIKYRSTFNDIPFVETEIYIVDDGKNCVITGEDGTVLWRFSINWLNKI